MASSQTNVRSVVDTGVKATSVGVGGFDQVISTRDTSAVKEVYYRRDGLMPKPSNEFETPNGVESSLMSTLPGLGVPNGDSSKGGLEENLGEDLANDFGHGVLALGSMGESPSMMLLDREVSVMIEELESLFVTRNLKLAVEVGSIAVFLVMDRKSCKWIV